MQVIAAALIAFGVYLAVMHGGGPPAGFSGPALIVIGFLLLAGGRAAGGTAVALMAGYNSDFASLSAYDGIVLPMVCAAAGFYVIVQLWRAGLIQGGGAGGDGGFDGGCDGGGGD